MLRKPCPHRLPLVKGLRCNHDYLEILLTVNGRRYARTFGIHSRESMRVAEIHLAEKRKEIMLGRFGFEKELDRKLFIDVADIWFKIWVKETKSDGRQAHNEPSQKETGRVIEKVFLPIFSKTFYDEVRPIDIERWREKGLANGLSGTTLNRYQATLSSLFGSVERWIKTERIKPAFKIPEGNPCTPVEKAPTVKRDRILTTYEAKKLKLAFTQLNDVDGWEICKLALKSVLSMKDLKGLHVGQQIDLNRAKTGVPVNIPLTVLVKLNWKNWRKRFERARKEAGLVGFEFRDLRKTGINWLKGRHDLKLVSEYAGHADIKTTEGSYTVVQSEKMLPLAKDLETQVEEI